MELWFSSVLFCIQHVYTVFVRELESLKEKKTVRERRIWQKLKGHGSRYERTFASRRAQKRSRYCACKSTKAKKAAISLNESLWLRRVSLRETNKPNTSGPVFFAPWEQHEVWQGLHSVTEAKECGYVLRALIIYFLRNNNRRTTDEQWARQTFTAAAWGHIMT